VYDLVGSKCLKILGNPFEEYTSNYFHSLQFTCDNKYVLALLGSPDWAVLCYEWQKGKIVSKFLALPEDFTGSVTQVNIYFSFLTRGILAKLPP
jgi:hypothetical protein